MGNTWIKDDPLGSLAALNFECVEAYCMPPWRMRKAARDDWNRILWKDPCSYCGAREGEYRDHIEPKSNGGPDTWDNLTGTCHSCNSSKGTLSLLAFLGRRQARSHLEEQVRLWRDIGSEAAA